MPDTATTNNPRVPAAGVSAWFSPRIEARVHRPGTAGAGSHAVTDGGPQEWAATETVRQFTDLGQYYSITRISAPALPGEEVEQATISCHRRSTAEGLPAREQDHTPRCGYDLVTIVATDSEEPDYEVADYYRFRHDHPLTPPAGTTLATLIKGAKRMLADGGTLAVQLPEFDPDDDCDGSTPGAVAAAQQAGLAYLQRIALVDSDTDDEQMAPASPQADSDGIWSSHTQGIPIHTGPNGTLLIFRKPAKENTLA